MDQAHGLGAWLMIIRLLKPLVSPMPALYVRRRAHLVPCTLLQTVPQSVAHPGREVTEPMIFLPVKDGPGLYVCPCTWSAPPFPHAVHRGTGDHQDPRSRLQCADAPHRLRRPFQDHLAIQTWERRQPPDAWSAVQGALLSRTTQAPPRLMVCIRRLAAGKDWGLFQLPQPPQARPELESSFGMGASLLVTWHQKKIPQKVPFGQQIPLAQP